MRRVLLAMEEESDRQTDRQMDGDRQKDRMTENAMKVMIKETGRLTGNKKKTDWGKKDRQMR